MAEHRLPPTAWPLQYRHTEPDLFSTTARASNPFGRKDMYERTLTELRYELEQLQVTSAHLQLVLGGGEADLRRDGQLRARADVRHPGVALTLVTGEHGTLVYTCDAFEGRWSNDPPDWQINLRAITLGLHDLRRLDRYGIADRGQQYAGFKALGSGTAMSGGTHDRISLAKFIGTAAGWETPPDPDDLEAIRTAYREAARRHHPDVGGNPQMMAYLTSARDALGA